jgi:DhnA family fructose-bisphosphate aldolase class Ia
MPCAPVGHGGEKKVREKEVLEMVREIMEAGAYGVSIGRNIFQYKKPGNMIKAIKQIVHKGSSVSAAMGALKEEPIEGSIFDGTVIW